MKRTPLKSYSPLKRKGFVRKSGGRVVKACVVCGSEFLVYRYRALSARVCSRKCNGLHLRNRVPRVCENCGKQFETVPSQLRARKTNAKYCSRRCSFDKMITDTASKPIKDKYGRTGRMADKKWQAAVREKDNYTCQRCGKYEQYIHTHHVAPRSRRPDLRNDISNGKCLCNSCHSWVHEHPAEAVALGLLSGATYELARKKLRGAAHPGAKLTERDVVNIRARLAAGERCVVLASEFGVDRNHIHGINIRRTWRHI